MEDFKKLGWIIFNVIVYGCWISLIYELNNLIGVFDWGDSILTIVVLTISFIIQWVGGVYVVIYLQDYVSKKLNRK